MTSDDYKDEVVKYWLEKSNQALSSAEDDLSASRLTFSVNRAYYACFYALSALLLKDGQKFVKHTGVRAALHRHYVKAGRLDPQLGKFYNKLFDNRQRADYKELVEFDREQVEQILHDAEAFMNAIRRLLDS